MDRTDPDQMGAFRGGSTAVAVMHAASVSPSRALFSQATAEGQQALQIVCAPERSGRWVVQRTQAW